jgi:hypothetical protein
MQQNMTLHKVRVTLSFSHFVVSQDRSGPKLAGGYLRYLLVISLLLHIARASIFLGTIVHTSKRAPSQSKGSLPCLKEQHPNPPQPRKERNYTKAIIECKNW